MANMAFSDDPESEGVLVFADDVALTAENSTVTLLPPAGHDVFDTEVTYAMLVWPGVHQLDILLTDADGYVYLATVKYKVSDSVSKASDLEDGGMYFICAKWDTNRCWYVADASGTLRLSNSQPDLQNLPKEYVFIFDIDQNHSDIAVDERYKYESGIGAWKSLSSNKYLSTNSPMMFNLIQPGQYVKCASGWEKQDQAGIFDICRNSTEMIGFGTDLYWGTTSQLISGIVQYWKGQIFKVVKE